jgi:hypothetical protein
MVYLQYYRGLFIIWKSQKHRRSDLLIISLWETYKQAHGRDERAVKPGDN